MNPTRCARKSEMALSLSAPTSCPPTKMVPWLIDATNEVEQGCLPTIGRSHDHGKALAGNVKGDALDCRHLDISLLIDFDNVRKTDYWSACVFGFRGLSQSLRFHFCPCPSILWVKRYVPCSVTARQPWLVAIFGTPRH